MSYDPFSRRFDVTFELPGDARAQWRYTGSAVETIEAAVATRALARGDVVKAGDIVIERRPKNEFSSEPPALAGDGRRPGGAPRGARRPAAAHCRPDEARDRAARTTP